MRRTVRLRLYGRRPNRSLFGIAFASALLASACHDTAGGTGPLPLATHLVVTTQPTTTALFAVVTPPITVTAEDANGDLDETFTGAVTLRMGVDAAPDAPVPVKLYGTLTENAICGVATFKDIGINASASGYTIVASSGSLASTTTAPFAITPLYSSIAKNGGDNQTGPPSTVLRSPIIVIVLDPFGVPSPGVSVQWAVTSGGGSVGYATMTTDNTGMASVQWILGPALGAQTATASALGRTGSPVTFTATAVTSASAQISRELSGCH